MYAITMTNTIINISPMGKLCTRPRSMRNQNKDLSPVLIEMITLHCLIKKTNTQMASLINYIKYLKNN